MAHGFFTIEQWRGKQWLPVCQVDGCRSLTVALRELERRGNPGFFRVMQMQRMVWTEKTDGKLRLRKWHANSPDTLSRTARAYDRDGGRWPARQRG